ncbi:hypothetical protein [Aquibium oceanicum]|uniref:Uncharacterized protein n=1 Tax=Aquibium oceanicum TaxID=1670800 RepID=A0A1L3SXP2_9HYPH|nr:hypothetical protein [Aquibium oceanicum]APH74131.1 hypothetical protein BSQ44_24240 [Aquibium oceanicum]
MREPDYQKSRVYRWEDIYIKPRDQSQVPFDAIQPIVNHVWPTPHPPIVRPFAGNGGRGHRLRVRFPTTAPTPTWVILHEVAHALTHGDKHGPDFVGAYMQLLNRYLAIDLPFLYHTARISNVQYSVTVQLEKYL